jgi:hypothetical protein
MDRMLHRSRRRIGTVAALVPALLVVLLSSATPAGAADAPSRSWIARLGPGGGNGTAVVLLSADPATGQVRVALRGLPARAAVASAVRAGTCAARGRILAPLPPGRATVAGRFSRSRALSVAEAGAIETAGPMIVTVRAGAVSRCAPLVERPMEGPGPSPSPTPSPTAVPSPTATPSPSPSPSGGVSVEVGRKFMVGGSMYLSVQWVSPFIDAVGNTGVLLGVQLEALVPGLSASSEDFRMVQPDGSLRRPVYCTACDDIPAPWAAQLSTTVPYRGKLLFLAPVLGPLNLRFTASFGSVTIHVRD